MIPVISSSRIILRAHVLNDFNASASMWADPRVVTYISGTPSSREESWSRFLRYAGHWKIMGYGYWAIEHKKTGEFLGEIGFANYRRDMEPSLNDKPEAGWVLASAAHGKGYASEAIECIVSWADNHLEYDSTVCILNPAHQVSIHLANKVGYIENNSATYKGQALHVLERRRKVD